jgi:hypothetical protein
VGYLQTEGLKKNGQCFYSHSHQGGIYCALSEGVGGVGLGGGGEDDRRDAGVNPEMLRGKGRAYKILMRSLLCTLSFGPALEFFFYLVVEKWWGFVVALSCAQVVSHYF